MPQYQSFPGVKGDSLSFEKLAALKLPDLSGRSFLDVGCNEGYFCGYAKFCGANVVVGLDQSLEFINRARERFPRCDFYHQDWSNLPNKKFDIILLASALHYADDQSELIAGLMGHLSSGGTLVLELGVVAGSDSRWVEVKRGIDTRFFPTWGKISEVLNAYAWKHVGPSVSQSGDPVSRHVIHVRHRLPVAYLLTKRPGYGKSSIARSLFRPAGINVISADELIAKVVSGKQKASARFESIASEDFSHTKIDKTFSRLFANGMLQEWVDLCVQLAGSNDFAFDGYVPESYVSDFSNQIRRRGYMVVSLDWERVGEGWRTLAEVSQSAKAYHESLLTCVKSVPSGSFPFRVGKGFVDAIELSDQQVLVKGWAMNDVGLAFDRLALDIDGVRRNIEIVRKQARPDVVRHFGGGDMNCGFDFSVPVNIFKSGSKVVDSLKLYAASFDGEFYGPFSFSGGVDRDKAFL